MKILRHLKRLKTDIALLQETHLSTSDFHRMKKLWVGTVLGSDSNKHKAGVLILIHKNLPCEVLSTKADTQGRLISAHIKLGTKDMIISNIYAPNNPTKQFYSELSSWLLSNPTLPHIAGGDFNSTAHPIDDRSTSKRTFHHSDLDSQTLLASTMESLHLRDIWRLRHPADRDFTFYSNPHNVFTRIDYLFCSDDLLPLISDADIHDIAISDHAPILTTIDNLDLYPNPKIWRFPSYLHNNSDFRQYMENVWSEYTLNNAEHSDNPNLFWEAGKAFLRGRIISYAASFKRNALKNYKQASSRLHLAQRSLYINNSSDNRKAWQSAKQSFDT